MVSEPATFLGFTTSHVPVHYSWRAEFGTNYRQLKSG